IWEIYSSLYKLNFLDNLSRTYKYKPNTLISQTHNIQLTTDNPFSLFLSHNTQTWRLSPFSLPILHGAHTKSVSHDHTFLCIFFLLGGGYFTTTSSITFISELHTKIQIVVSEVDGYFRCSVVVAIITNKQINRVDPFKVYPTKLPRKL
ncbi:hypothetical protein VIGAN_03041100, partial [Vigna angularis var. angularis]